MKLNRNFVPALPAFLALIVLICTGCGASSTTSSSSSSSTTSTTTTLVSSSSSTTTGTSITLTATVFPSAAAGTVEFYDTTTSAALGTATLSSGTATLSVSFSVAETHVLEAIYEGSSIYASSTSSTVSVVVSASLTSTTTTLTASSYSTTAGASVTLTAAVSPSAATGTVTFYNGTTSLGTGTLSSGTATLATSFSSAGTYTLTATYGGNSSYTTSTSSSISVAVSSSSSTGNATSTSLTTASSAAYPYSLVALTATITANGSVVTSTSGTVTFSYTTSSDTTPTELTCSNTSSTTASVNSSGTAVCATHFTSTTDSPYTITATYSGDSTYSASTSNSVTETVTAGSYSLDLSSYTPTTGSTTAENGDTVKYTAYTNVIYAVDPVDSSYESMNIYIPTSVGGTSVSGKPILFDINVGGYTSAQAGGISTQSGSNDSYALNNGYVIVSPGCRGRDNGSSGDYYGVAPAAIMDLKAAVRFLRLNAGLGTFNGDVSHIIDDGGSAGGGLAALLGASGNSPLYYPDAPGFSTVPPAYYGLAHLGAADADDNIFAVGAQSPITNLDHADMSYEMEYGYNTLGSVNETISQDLIGLFENYQSGLGLSDKRSSDLGTLDASTLTTYIVEDYLEPSLERYLDNNSSATAPSYASCSKSSGSYTCTIGSFAAYVQGAFGSRSSVKAMPAFDAFFDMTSSSPDYSVIEADTTNLNTTCQTETLAFGNPTGTADSSCTTSGNAGNSSSGSPRHFTDFSSQAMDGTDVSTTSMQTVVNMMNPMYFLMNAINGASSSGVAPYWYVRDGTIAPDTSAYVIVDLATAAENLLGTSHVDAWEDWGVGHNVETDSSGNQTGVTFMTWVVDSVAAN